MEQEHQEDMAQMMTYILMNRRRIMKIFSILILLSFVACSDKKVDKNKTSYKEGGHFLPLWIDHPQKWIEKNRAHDFKDYKYFVMKKEGYDTSNKACEYTYQEVEKHIKDKIIEKTKLDVTKTKYRPKI